MTVLVREVCVNDELVQSVRAHRVGKPYRRESPILKESHPGPGLLRMLGFVAEGLADGEQVRAGVRNGNRRGEALAEQRQQPSALWMSGLLDHRGQQLSLLDTQAREEAFHDVRVVEVGHDLVAEP